MAFLTTDEMKTHIYPGVSSAISNQDITILQDAIDAAVDEAKGYCSRFNTDLLFSGSDRPPMLLFWVKSIAKWNFITLANPNIDYQDAQIRYEQATQKLKDIQSGKLVPKNWPLETPQEKSQTWHVSSSTPKRNNHFNSLNPFDPFFNQYPS